MIPTCWPYWASYSNRWILHKLDHTLGRIRTFRINRSKCTDRAYSIFGTAPKGIWPIWYFIHPPLILWIEVTRNIILALLSKSPLYLGSGFGYLYDIRLEGRYTVWVVPGANKFSSLIYKNQLCFYPTDPHTKVIIMNCGVNPIILRVSYFDMLG